MCQIKILPFKFGNICFNSCIVCFLLIGVLRKYKLPLTFNPSGKLVIGVLLKSKPPPTFNPSGKLVIRVLHKSNQPPTFNYTLIVYDNLYNQFLCILV